MIYMYNLLIYDLHIVCMYTRYMFYIYTKDIYIYIQLLICVCICVCVIFFFMVRLELQVWGLYFCDSHHS